MGLVKTTSTFQQLVIAPRLPEEIPEQIFTSGQFFRDLKRSDEKNFDFDSALEKDKLAWKG